MRSPTLRHFGCRILDDLTLRGLRIVFLENEVLRVGVLLDKGADIFSFLHKPSDTDFLWRSPGGLRNPQAQTATVATNSSAFLDAFHGGWQEILPGGGPVTYRGAPLGLHGEVTSLPWTMQILRDEPRVVEVLLTVECIRTPFRLERQMRLESGSPVLTLVERLTNLSPTPQDVMWGHHPAFGAPFLRAGVRLIIPATTAEVHSPRWAADADLEPGSAFAWPMAASSAGDLDLSRVPGEEARSSGLLYLRGLAAGWFAVLDPARRIGFGLAWPVEVFPYLWFWHVYGGSPGYPWWDRAYVAALEPWTSIPNDLNQAIERGTQLQLKGGETLEVTLSAVAISGRETVSAIGTDGTLG
jgi:hypothetical protein